MLFGKSRVELKVGIFVFFGVIILMTFILMIGDFKTWGSSRRIPIIFNFVNGVKLGAPVRFAGVDVGEVKDIQFFYSQQEQKTKVKLVALIRNDATIPGDSKVWVNTLGLLGEKYLEIMPGEDYKNPLADNQVVIGNDPVAMHEIGEVLKSIAENLDEAIAGIKSKEGSLGKLLYDDSLYKELLALIGSVDQFVQQSESMVEDIKANPWKLFYKPKDKKR